MLIKTIQKTGRSVEAKENLDLTEKPSYFVKSKVFELAKQKAMKKQRIWTAGKHGRKNIKIIIKQPE